jgi:hypothetical protein
MGIHCALEHTWQCYHFSFSSNSLLQLGSLGFQFGFSCIQESAILMRSEFFIWKKVVQESTILMRSEFFTWKKVIKAPVSCCIWLQIGDTNEFQGFTFGMYLKGQNFLKGCTSCCIIWLHTGYTLSFKLSHSTCIGMDKSSKITDEPQLDMNNRLWMSIMTQ